MLAVYPAQTMPPPHQRSSPWSAPGISGPAYPKSNEGYEARQQRPHPDVFQNPPVSRTHDAYSNHQHKGHSIDRDDLLGPQPQSIKDQAIATSPTHPNALSDSSSTRSSPPSGRISDTTDGSTSAVSPRPPSGFVSASNANTEEGRRRSSIADSIVAPNLQTGFAPLSPFIEAFSPASATAASGERPSPSLASFTQSFSQRSSGTGLASKFANPQPNSVSNPVHLTNANTEELPFGPLPTGPGSFGQAPLGGFNDRLNSNGLGGAGGLARGTQIQTGPPSAMGDEEITTIFVVGFPDDMQEREFQNMFVFSPGFEAATLKTPGSNIIPNGLPGSGTSSSSREGNITSSSNANYHLDAYGRSYLPGFDHPHHHHHPYHHQHQHSLDDPLLQRERERSNMNATSSSNNISNSVLGLDQPRKQIIGFAKFRTRQEAIDARDVLSGRRVDADRDCILKAEMAKKNLHTKRGLANEAPAGAQSSVGVGNPAGNNSLPPSLVARGQANLAAAAALDPAVLAGALALQANAQGSSVQQLLRDGEQSLRDVRSQQIQSATYNAFHSSDRRHLNTLPGSAIAAADPRYTSHAPLPENTAEMVGGGGNSSWQAPNQAFPMPSASVAAGPSPRAQQSHLGKSLMQQLDANTLPYSTATSATVIGQTSDGYTRHSFYNSGNMPSTMSDRAFSPTPGGSSSRLAGVSLNTALAQSARPQSPQSPSLTSPRGSANNPADMNPPINTLYVGGLPAVLPSLTGPMSASHLEDSLRAVFSRSPGFKRLNFRQKSNGPMSFVEYDSVEYATRALHELYGHTLGGLVKGGIRLSYSKNPLGVRSNSLSTGGPQSPPLPNGVHAYNQDPFAAMATPTSSHPRRLTEAAQAELPASTGASTLRSTTSPAPYERRPFSPFSSSIDLSNGY